MYKRRIKPLALTDSSYTGLKAATWKIAVLPLSQMESVPRSGTILRFDRDHIVFSTVRDFLRMIAAIESSPTVN